MKRLPAERLAAARLTGILLLLDDASPNAARRQLDAADPQHVSAARQPRHARELPIALGETVPVTVTDPVTSAAPVLAAGVPPREVLASEVTVPDVTGPEAFEAEALASEVPGAGRHRRPGVQTDVTPAHESPAHESPAPETSGTGRHRRPGVPAAGDWAHPSPVPGLSTSGARGAGHHRRSGVRVAMALRGVRVAPPRVVLLGLLVLLVAFAAVLQVRGSAALESAQPHADAATSHSTTMIVSSTR
ncbi:MAG: hypothetical protein HHJ11_12625 [Phycicoccus sp.]|nr:hypothetical protein [Phycicoccus sp.]